MIPSQHVHQDKPKILISRIAQKYVEHNRCRSRTRAPADTHQLHPGRGSGPDAVPVPKNMGLGHLLRRLANGNLSQGEFIMKNWCSWRPSFNWSYRSHCQEKARGFVQGKGSEDLATSGSGAGGRHWAAWSSRSTVDSHDESMEVTKDLQKNCPAVTVTINQANADYTIMFKSVV